MKKFYINSSHGCLTVNLETGDVIHCEADNASDPECYIQHIKNFDLQEWKTYYPDEQIEENSNHDILDFGYTDNEGYQTPELGWRKEREEMIEKERMNKPFFWKDKTGRGFAENITLNGILACEDQENYDGESLHEWAKDAEPGDEFESSTDKYTCIKK